MTSEQTRGANKLFVRIWSPRHPFLIPYRNGNIWTNGNLQAFVGFQRYGTCGESVGVV